MLASTSCLVLSDEHTQVDMMKRNLSGMVPQLAMGMVVNFFFNGWGQHCLSLSLLLDDDLVQVRSLHASCLTDVLPMVVAPGLLWVRSHLRSARGSSQCFR
jgi:hypothetical protein